ncbi:type VI secretion system protein TssA [Stieleria mannarensis]|uniref:type VI secretion system protein TssA n=1 Tax=Stieleria mannarensis TaxID=2755585 RepID=UPI001600107F|nr:type VI secretion system protein TssA [Rhodopirellula sp. JC639]
MASEPTLDFDQLIAPISDDSPSGQHLRRRDFERFQRAKDARAEAVNAERKIREFAMYDEDELAALQEQGQGVEVPSAPDWRVVLDQCIDIIANHSKDLWVASWLIEANTRRNGYAGARDGFRLVNQICESYWEGIYPPHDEEDGYLDTVSQITSLNGLEGAGTLIAPLEEIPLLPGFGALTFAAYREATTGGGGGEVTESDFDNAVRQIDLDQLRQQEEDIAEAIAAFKEMTATLEDKCRVEGDEEDHTPPSSQIRRTLESIQQAFSNLTRNLLSGDSDAGGEGDAETSATGLAPNAAPQVDLAQAQVNNREDAFRMLMKASEFFRKTEPHSPVSYMLQQTVEFGRMDLPTLLQRLIQDSDVLRNLSERTGIPVKDDEYDED